jgi:hypothetical protein
VSGMGHFALFVAILSSLQVPGRVLKAPDAALSRPFERITGLHELRDGRVIVVDANEQSVLIADFTNDRVVQLGRQGSGPGEYRFPMRLLRLGGDSIGADDGGNGRILVITGTGRLSGILSSLGTRMGSPKPPGAEPPLKSDNQGRLYALGFYLPFGPRANLTDSTPIERWRVGSQARDTIAYLPLLPANRRVPPPGTATRAFTAEPEWAVGPEGRIAILHVEPYSVDVVDSRGVKIAGRPISYQRVRVSDEHKRQWREELARPRPVTMITPKGVQTAGLEPGRAQEPVQWPAYLPAFLDNAGRFAPDGILWIQRTVPANSAALFDLVDGRGVVIAQVRAPEHSRVIGFGSAHVYVARVDQEDQEFLERYKAEFRNRP